jgi:hypothetical protein
MELYSQRSASASWIGSIVRMAKIQLSIEGSAIKIGRKLS